MHPWLNTLASNLCEGEQSLVACGGYQNNISRSHGRQRIAATHLAKLPGMIRHSFAESMSQTCMPIIYSTPYQAYLHTAFPPTIARRSHEPSLRVDSAVVDPTSSDSLMAGIVASSSEGLHATSSHSTALIQQRLGGMQVRFWRSVGYMRIPQFQRHNPLHVPP